jgi:hypothetical protein
MDINAALVTLDTILDDNGDVTFTSVEKTRALTKAFNDPFVVNPFWDSSLTYTQGTYQYALPLTLSTLQDIYISPSGSTQPFPSPIDSDMWELVNGNIQFRQRADYLIPNTYVLYLKGYYKLKSTDTITDPNMQEYVLALAGFNTLTMLGHKKANLFVKNDTTMPELIGLRRELLAEVKEYRARLPKAYESA